MLADGGGVDSSGDFRGADAGGPGVDSGEAVVNGEGLGVNSRVAAADGGDWAGGGIVSSGDFRGADAGGLGVDSGVAVAVGEGLAVDSRAAPANGEAFGVKVGEGVV